MTDGKNRKVNLHPYGLAQEQSQNIKNLKGKRKTL
jgi:hypothetical protein